MFKNIQNLVAAMAVATALLAPGAAHAGRGGSAAKILNAVQSGSVDAIVAEVERTERLVCGGCIDVVRELLDHPRYEVREVAAWWFAKRPALAEVIRTRSLADLVGKDSEQARNGADFLGTLRNRTAVPALSTAAVRTDLSAEARLHIVRALGTIADASANPALTAAVRDADAGVRAEAAAVIGNVRDGAGRAALEAALGQDADAVVRRNAAWALGRIGNAASRTALDAGSRDASPLVRLTAMAALSELH
jgi:HEAT repeat protein